MAVFVAVSASVYVCVLVCCCVSVRVHGRVPGLACVHVRANETIPPQSASPADYLSGESA